MTKKSKKYKKIHENSDSFKSLNMRNIIRIEKMFTKGGKLIHKY